MPSAYGSQQMHWPKTALKTCFWGSEKNAFIQSKPEAWTERNLARVQLDAMLFVQSFSLSSLYI